MLALIASAGLLIFLGFIALGTWQLERRAWKLALMDRVEHRVQAPAASAPAAASWPQVNAADDEYRRVQAAGVFLNELETLVQASTELGAGFWVLTPLRLADGSVVLVNRGFVPPEARGRAAHGAGLSEEPARITGLLRLTEPHGAFLRRNDAAANRWYSRDVQAIAEARGLREVAPYFIDAEATPQAATRTARDAAADAANAPVGGLTVVRFHNNHLVYAITWYALALMVAGATWVGREELRQRSRRGTADD